MKLPLDCEVSYYESFLTDKEAKELFDLLIHEYKIDKERIVIEAGGEIIETDSFKILFSTKDLIAAKTHPEHIHGKVYEWAGPMKKLKESVEKLTGQEFEIAMCLFYPDGNFFAPYHNDQMTSGHNTILPSISLGEVREFSFKENNSEEEYKLNLAHGSLLVMGDYCQERYTHSLPKNKKYKYGRINITFREASFK